MRAFQFSVCQSKVSFCKSGYGVIKTHNQIYNKKIMILVISKRNNKMQKKYGVAKFLITFFSATNFMRVPDNTVDCGKQLGLDIAKLQECIRDDSAALLRESGSRTESLGIKWVYFVVFALLYYSITLYCGDGALHLSLLFHDFVSSIRLFGDIIETFFDMIQCWIFPSSLTIMKYTTFRQNSILSSFSRLFGTVSFTSQSCVSCISYLNAFNQIILCIHLSWFHCNDCADASGMLLIENICIYWNFFASW